MLRLLKIEFLKFKNASVIAVMMLLYLVISPFIILGIYDVLKNASSTFFNMRDIIEFPTVWDWQGYIGSYFVCFILGYIVLYTITSEVSHKTMRQNIINGYTRKDYFLAKLINLIFLSVGATVIYALSSLIIGIISTDGWDMSLALDNNYAIGRFFLMAFGNLSFATLVGFLVRRSGMAIFVYFGYILILEPIFKFLVHLNLFNNFTVNYWPLNMIEDNMPNPVLTLPDNFMKNNDFQFDLLLDYSTAAVGSIIYSIGFLALAWYTFKKRDI